jgi:putative FmdB family regulatory protein
MPTYSYAGNVCGYHFDCAVRIADRDTPQACPECQTTPAIRLSTAPSFTIKGFNAANGYARRTDR